VSAWAVFGIGAVTASVLMLVLWLLQVRIRDATHVDVGWAYGIGLLAILYAVLGGGTTPHRVLIAVLVSLWSLRLGTYVLVRGVIRGEGEDRRYAEMRARYGRHANRNFFVFFQAQAAFVAVFSIPALLASFNGSPAIEPLEWVGAAVWAVGVAGEWIADRQLSRWKAEHPGVTARGGLWRYSRHPNYFFEWVTWVGLALVAAAAPWGWVAFLTPAFLLVLILFVTGIPPSERQALRSRGDDYRRYQRETSAFVPWPPKR
jgi:steroid 5-alpha reductase family enzyme